MGSNNSGYNFYRSSVLIVLGTVTVHCLRKSIHAENWHIVLFRHIKMHTFSTFCLLWFHYCVLLCRLDPEQVIWKANQMLAYETNCLRLVLLYFSSLTTLSFFLCFVLQEKPSLPFYSRRQLGNVALLRKMKRRKARNRKLERIWTLQRMVIYFVFVVIVFALSVVFVLFFCCCLHTA